MIFPHTREEQKLRKQGYAHIAGSDEAGRGAWAGPLVAAAVILPPKHRIRGIRDSKKLSPEARERLYEHITRLALAWSFCVISPRTIDSRGITYANREALHQAIKKLSPHPHAVLIDAVRIDTGIPTRAIINGDEIVQIIAAASIIAKVTRDRMMRRLHQKLPHWGFEQHKGYGTAHHQEMLRRHGISRIHRLSFSPIRAMATKSQ